MNIAEKLTENIYRIKIPFDNIYTSVFIIKTEDFLILADTATTKEDVTDYIIPAIQEMGGNLRYVILSHTHGDHAGGYKHIKEIYPEVKVILYDENYAINKGFTDYIIPEDEEIFFDCIKVFNFKGHSKDSLGLLDTRTNTLLTFDSFQLFGVGRYGTGLWDVNEYLESVKRAKELMTDMVIAAHEFYPYGAVINGKKGAIKFFDGCTDCIDIYREFMCNNQDKNPDELAELYNNTYPERPTVSTNLFSLITKYSSQN